MDAIQTILTFGGGNVTPCVYTPSPLGGAATPYTALPTWKAAPTGALAAFKDALLKEALALLAKFVDALLVGVATLGVLNAKLQAVTFAGPCSL